jgi:hypothetical protein
MSETTAGPYPDDEIRAVPGGNVYRVLQSIWAEERK